MINYRQTYIEIAAASQSKANPNKTQTENILNIYPHYSVVI